MQLFDCKYMCSFVTAQILCENILGKRSMDVNLPNFIAEGGGGGYFVLA
jgi:hypothetical protein